jgi:hypothetical protein
MIEQYPCVNKSWEKTANELDEVAALDEKAVVIEMLTGNAECTC